MSEVTMRAMFEAGIYFGHQTSSWHPAMAPYLYGSRNKIHIINLEKTLPLFKGALNFAGRVSARNGKILFVGTKRAAREIVREHAIRCDMPYIDFRWLGGMLTNFKTVKQSVKRLTTLQEMRDDGTFAQLTKKEGLMLQRELDKLERGIGGIKNMKSLPDAIFVIDVGQENIGIKEANSLSIPVIGVVDTNNNPAGVNYIVPGNDDSKKAIEFYASHMADTIIAAKEAASGRAKFADEFVEIDEDPVV